LKSRDEITAHYALRCRKGTWLQAFAVAMGLKIAELHPSEIATLITLRKPIFYSSGLSNSKTSKHTRK
jgi:hypothetical protein